METSTREKTKLHSDSPVLFMCYQVYNFLPTSLMSVLLTNHCAPSSVNPTKLVSISLVHISFLENICLHAQHYTQQLSNDI